MKKLSILLLSALLLLGVPAKAPAEAAPTEISSRAELMQIARNPAGSYVLTADLDLGGEPWTPIPFSGTLDGGGHTLYNLTVTEPGPDGAVTYDGNRKQYDTALAGLFSVVTDAHIFDLNLINAEVRIVTDRDCFIAALAGYARHSLVERCSVVTRAALTLSGTNEGVGGLIGFCDESEISACTVDCELTFTDTNPDIDCEEFLGGVYAAGSGRVFDCTVKTRGFAEIYGYAHGGGIIGMHKLRRNSKFRPRLTGCTVDAELSFFEVAPARRAYCAALIGEDSAKDCYLTKNTTLHFEKSESRRPVRLRPDPCEAPVYAAAVTEPTCSAWGFTTYTCTVCGYSYVSDYTAPAHRYERADTAPTCAEWGFATFTCVYCGDAYTEPTDPPAHRFEQTRVEPTCEQAGEIVETCALCGETRREALPALGHEPGAWETVTLPAVGAEGSERRVCKRCGKALETRVVPALPAPEPVPAERVALDRSALSLTVGETASLTFEVLPENASDRTVLWSTSDPGTVTVTPGGVVTAEAVGAATVTATSADGRASASCTVTVTRTLWQTIRYYVLFGWLWER